MSFLLFFPSLPFIEERSPNKAFRSGSSCSSSSSSPVHYEKGTWKRVRADSDGPKKFAREREVYKALPLSIRWLRRRRRRKKRSGIWRLMPGKRRRIEEGRKGLIEVTTLLSLLRRPRAREDRLSLRKEPSFFKEAAFSWLALFARQSSPEKTS